MVKSITTIICGFLVLLSVSSCRKEQEEPCPENGRVTFTVAQTRATQEGTFEKGNSIGVFAIEPKTGVYWATNNKYTYDGRAFKPANSPMSHWTKPVSATPLDTRDAPNP